MRYYWDSALKKKINDLYLREDRVLKHQDLLNMRNTLQSNLQKLKCQRVSNLNESKEQFRKNFTKSLDHKSF